MILNFDVGAISSPDEPGFCCLPSAFARARHSVVFPSLSHTVTFHIEREASVHDVAVFRNVAGVNDLPCAHAKYLDHLLVHSRYLFFFIRSTKHCIVVLRCWPDPCEFISCHGVSSHIIALMARPMAAHASVAFVSRRLNLPYLLSTCCLMVLGTANYTR